jgi:hypothetical protein
MRLKKVRLVSRARFFQTLLIFVVLSGIAAAGAAGDIMRKGPYLLYEGSGKGMKVLWQTWRSPDKGTCRIGWGYTPGLEGGSEEISERGTGLNGHLFSFHIGPPQGPGVIHYRVTCDGESHKGSFNAPAGDAKGPLSFYALGDTRPNGLFSSRYTKVLARLLKDRDADPAHRRGSFVLHLGDFVRRGLEEKGWDQEFFFRNGTNDRFLASIPVLGVAGNHEGYDGRDDEDRKPFGGLFRKYFPYAMYRHGVDRFYYSFDYGPVHVAALDVNDRAGPAVTGKNREEGLNRSAAGLVPGTEQYEWLKADLQMHQPWKIVMFHNPMWSAAPLRDRFLEKPELRENLHRLFREKGVRLVLQGHHHFYSRCEVDGITYLTLGGGGVKLGNVDSGRPFVKQAREVHHFARFDAGTDGLTVTIIDIDGNLVEPPFTVRLTVKQSQ